MKYFYCLTAGLLCSLSVSAAAESALLTEADYMGDIPLVITATRLDQPLSDTPASMTVIDRAMIEASGFQDIADLLRLVPGFQVGKSTLDHAPAVTYHGQADGFPRRMQVLVDGRSVFGAVFSNVDWDGLGLQVDDIKRIEVIRGPNAPVYGANAFTAVINIITYEPFEQQGWSSYLAGGTDDSQTVAVKYNGHFGKTDYQTNIYTQKTGAFDNRDDDLNITGVRLKSYFTPSPANIINTVINYNTGPLGRGGETLALIGVDEKQVRRHNEFIKWTYHLGKGRESIVSFNHDYHRENDTANVGTLGEITGATDAEVEALFPGRAGETLHWGVYNYAAQRLDLQWQYKAGRPKPLRFVFGLDYRLDRFKSSYLINENTFVENHSGRLSWNAEFKANHRWIYHFGIMVEHSKLFNTDVSPRLALNYHAGENHTIRSSITRAYRNPSLIEEHFDYGLRFDDGTLIDQNHFSSGGLSPEEMTSFELGYYGRWFNRTLTWDVRVFHEEIRNEIEEVKRTNFPEPITLMFTGAFLRLNTGATDIDGFETQLQMRPDRNRLLTLQYAYADADMDPHRRSTRTRYSFTGTPEHTLSALTKQRFGNNMEIGVGIYYVSKMAWYGDGDDNLAYHRTDIRLANYFFTNQQENFIALVVQNIGSDYYEYRVENIFDTRYFLQAKLSFL